MQVFTCKSSLLYTRNSESALFLGLEKQGYVSQKVYFPQNRHKKKFLQKHVLDILPLSTSSGKIACTEGYKQGSRMISATHTVFTKSCALIPLLEQEQWRQTSCCFYLQRKYRTLHTNRKIQKTTFLGAHKNPRFYYFYTYALIVGN